AALATLALVIAVLVFRSGPAETPGATRFLIYPPEKATFGRFFAISPDGRRLAFRINSEGKVLLWVQALDSLAAQPLAGTEDSLFPFWSPDSRFVAFSSGGKLKKIEVTGGPAQTLCDAQDALSGAWNADGTIIFTHKLSLHRVSAAGGSPVLLTVLDASRKELFHGHPSFLPDGRHFLYYVNSSIRENGGIMLGSLDSKETKHLLKTDSNAVFAPPGYLVFLRERT
ncbi:MAG: hypothetical protein LC776_09865, partial [Acidobacteria bacterium]|nr:hypothetical protein [Acidobacteriota bacterium]